MSILLFQTLFNTIREFFGFKKQRNKPKMDIEKPTTKPVYVDDDEEIARKIQEYRLNPNNKINH